MLAGGCPEQLPGIGDVAAIAKDLVIVSTADAFITALATAIYLKIHSILTKLDYTALRASSRTACTSRKGDYWGYNQHCVQAKSDVRDAGQVFRYLRGPMTGRVIDMRFTDASELYQQHPPTWVAGGFTKW
jgi:hypothetical protein